MAGSAEVPPTRGRSSARHVMRHFLFTVPNQPPAMELYVTRDLTNEPPDGAFEIGLVSGFLSGFSAKAGFTHGPPVFEEAMVGSARVKRCRVELSSGDRRLWLCA